MLLGSRRIFGCLEVSASDDAYMSVKKGSCLGAMQADRDWYNQEEGGIVDETHNPFVGDESKFEQREVELQKKLVHYLTQECTAVEAFCHDTSMMSQRIRAEQDYNNLPSPYTISRAVQVKLKNASGALPSLLAPDKFCQANHAIQMPANSWNVSA